MPDLATETSRLRYPLVLAGILVVLPGCAAEEETRVCTPVPPSGAVEELVIPRWWALDWIDTPHRVRKLGFGVEQQGDQLVHLVGGTFSTGEEGSDTADVELAAERIRSRGWAGTSVRTTLELTGGAVTDGVDRPATGSVSLPVTLPAADPDWTWTALLTGYHLDTALSHTAGYTMRGFRVRPHLAHAAGGWRLEVRGGVHAGDEPARTSETYDAIDQNLESYGAVLTATVLLVGAPDTAVTRTRVVYDYVQEEGVEPEQRQTFTPVELPVGGACPQHAVAWMGGAEVRLNSDGGDYPGRYLREIRMGVTDVNFTPGARSMRVAPVLYWSNRGLVTRRTVVAVDYDMVTVGLSDPDLEVTPVGAAGEVTVGTTRFPGP